MFLACAENPLCLLSPAAGIAHTHTQLHSYMEPSLASLARRPANTLSAVAEKGSTYKLVRLRGLVPPLLVDPLRALPPLPLVLALGAARGGCCGGGGGGGGRPPAGEVLRSTTARGLDRDALGVAGAAGGGSGGELAASGALPPVASAACQWHSGTSGHEGECECE